MKRIRRLAYPKGASGDRSPLLTAVIFLAAAVMALAGCRPSHLNKAPPLPSAIRNPIEISPYDRWLIQEVVYIITDEERAAFEKLATDEERDKFIAQFWERRNANPGSPENKFKEEHYRRIAYANEHFAAGRPGWQTDRGHMYIVYGPPDEILHHTYDKQAHVLRPFEVWTYRHLPDIGDNVSLTFIDRTGMGDYQVAPGNVR